jgi:urea transporter
MDGALYDVVVDGGSTSSGGSSGNGGGNAGGAASGRTTGGLRGADSLPPPQRPAQRKSAEAQRAAVPPLRINLESLRDVQASYEAQQTPRVSFLPSLLSARNVEGPATHLTPWERCKWLLSHLNGTMPDLSDKLGEWRTPLGYALDFVNYTLRGSGQLVFMSNPLTGFLILVAILIDNPWLCFCGTLGLVGSTIAALLFGFEAAPRRSGIFGFNGLLTGLGIGFFQSETWRGALAALLYGGCSTVLTAALGNFFVPVFKAPPFTLPGNIAIYLYLLSSYQSAHFTVNTDLIKPTVLVPDVGVRTTVSELSVEDVVLGALRGVGQVFFVTHTVSCVLIVAAIGIASRISACMALFGCAVGVGTAIALGAPAAQIREGLYAYDACLGAIAIGGMFYYFDARVVAFTAANCIGCEVLHAALVSVLSVLGVGPGTLSFCLSSITFMLLRRSVGRIKAVELSSASTPEGNLLRRRAVEPSQHHQGISR